MTNAFNHGGVIARIAENDTAFQSTAQRAQSGPIGDIARGEQ